MKGLHRDPAGEARLRRVFVLRGAVNEEQRVGAVGADEVTDNKGVGVLLVGSHGDVAGAVMAAPSGGRVWENLDGAGRRGRLLEGLYSGEVRPATWLFD